MIGFIGLLASLALLIFMTMKGMSPLIAAPLCTFLLAVVSGIAIFPEMVGEGDPSFVSSYMSGFAGFVQSWFLMFLLGACFGKAMEDTKAATAVSRFLMAKFGAKYALLAVVITCAVLTYGGVSLFIVGFTVFPIALALFRLADMPRRFIPGAIAFGSVTFTMTSAGSPEIQNWIPIETLGTSPYSGALVSLIVAIFMFGIGFAWLNFMVKKAMKRGERFVGRDDDPREFEGELPNPFLSAIPLIVVLMMSFIFHFSLGSNALIISLASGIITAYLLNFRFSTAFGKAAAQGAESAILAIANTAAVVGFGSVARETEAFKSAVEIFTSLPGDPLIGAGLAVTAIVALTGSASGGLTIVLPLVAPNYINQGVSPDALHRVATLASGSLDSLPHSGYVVTTIRVVCRENHKDAYAAVGALTVAVPLIGTALAVLLFSLGIG